MMRVIEGDGRFDDRLPRAFALREEIQDLIEDLFDEVVPPPRLKLIQGGAPSA